MNVRTKASIVIAAIALVAIAAWPLLGAQRAAAAKPYFAPVLPDYLYRDRTISFYEARVNSDPADQISALLLSSQYMQRYREALDVGDILRSINQGKRALVLQPQNNAGADGTLGGAYTALHLFRTALAYETAAQVEQPYDSNAPAQMASLDMELGRYSAARQALAIATRAKFTPTVMSVQARYDELTGKLSTARALLQTAMIQTDQVSDNSAQGRAWFHFRSGELAFSDGDVTTAIQDERDAVAIFPTFEMADRALARFCWATKNWSCARDAATAGAQIIPEPETLGYLADSQHALGDDRGAHDTQALIFAVERIGNAYQINDRLLAVYYSTHGVRLDDAVRIALREVASRGTEIYAQDTLAWADAMDGKWSDARKAAALATRFGTQDPRIDFHAGMIALHFGDTATARRDLQAALALNPTFDPVYADQARARLRTI